MYKSLYTLLVLLLPFILSSNAVSGQVSCDSAFNKTGYHLFTQDPSVRSLGLKVAANTDGSVFVAGIRGDDSLALWKYRPDGSLDRSFGYGGFRSIFAGAGGYQLYPMFVDLAIQRDGKVVVMATRWRLDAQKFGNTRSDIVLARFSADGLPDPVFNGNGLLIHRPDAGFQYRPSALAIDSTGPTDKIYVASLATENSNWSCPLGFGKWCISRYATNGSPDTEWMGTGHIQQSASFIRNAPTSSPMALPRAMRVLPSGKLLVAGGYNAADSGCFVFRLLPNGTFDLSYGQAGRIFRKWGALSGVAPDDFRANILGDESVVFSLHHDITSGASAYDSSVLYAIKNDPAGLPVTNFGTGGMLMSSYRNEGFHELSVDGNNNMMLCWNEADAGSQRMHFKRFTENGQGDTAFCRTDGHASLEPLHNDAVYSASYVYSASWTGDNQHFFVQEQRFDKANGMHMGLIKYKLGSKKAIPTSIRSGELASITVYPQPVSGLLHIVTTGVPLVRLALINSAGQPVIQQSAEGQTRVSVDMQRLPSGHYILRLQDKNGTNRSQSVIVTH